MKTTSTFRFLFSALFILFASAPMVQAQMSQYKFNQLFASAFEDVVAGDHSAALPILEQLYKVQPDHAQTAYLLGMVYLKQGNDLQLAAAILKHASKRYDAAHEHGRVEDGTAPGMVWLLLGEALAATGRHTEAVNAYRTYMTTIPLASIQRKSQVIERI